MNYHIPPFDLEGLNPTYVKMFIDLLIAKGPILVKDIGSWFGSTNPKVFDSFPKMYDAVRNDILKDKQWVKVPCRPMVFTSVLNPSFLAPVIGDEQSYRLGLDWLMPEEGHPDHAFNKHMSLAAHYSPILSLNEAISERQMLCCFPHESFMSGFSTRDSQFQSIADHSFPLAIARSSDCTSLNMPSKVTGVFRKLAYSDLQPFGVSQVEYQNLERQKKVYFLDLTPRGSKIQKYDFTMVGNVNPEFQRFWGGLYAIGHFENAEPLNINPLIVGLLETMKELTDSGVKVNLDDVHGMTLYGHGIRIHFEKNSSYYSIHIDADFSEDCSGKIKMFDLITKNFHFILRQLDSKISNLDDWDFSSLGKRPHFTLRNSQLILESTDPLVKAVSLLYS
jgi:hypothetical protein